MEKQRPERDSGRRGNEAAFGEIQQSQDAATAAAPQDEIEYRRTVHVMQRFRLWPERAVLVAGLAWRRR